MSNQKQNIGKGGSGLQAGRDINIYSVLRNPSILADVVNEISKINLDDESIYGLIKEAPQIEEKILHNNIKVHRYLIDDYQIYGKELENIYKTLEQLNPGRKGKLFRVISDFYKKEKGILTIDNNIELIRQNADSILGNVIEKLENEILKSSNLNAQNEDIKTSISIIVADSFIRCKILEDPNEL